MSIHERAVVQRLKLWLAPPFWDLLARTVRFEPPSAAPLPAAPVIYACLHRDLIPAILYVRPARPVLLVSLSLDGDILIRTLARDGFGFARGSTGPTGGTGFQRLLAALQDGRSVGIAVDGPRGPFGMVREGVLQLSRVARRPIVPLTFAVGQHWRLRTWDRTIVPRPGSRVRVVEEDPLLVPGEAGESELALWAARLARALRVEGE